MRSRVGDGLRGRAAHWSLRRRVGVFFALFAAVLAALAAAVVLSLVRFVHAGNQAVHRWAPAAEASQRLFTDLVNQDSGVRSYALGGSKEFLQPFQLFSARQEADEASLAKLVAGSPVLQRRLDDLRAAARQWRNQVAVPLISLVNAHDESARELVDDPDTKARFDLVRKASARLDASVARVKAAAVDDRHQALIALVTALSIAVVLLGGSGLLGWRGLHRWVLNPVDRLAGQTRKVARGHTRRSIRPSGPPELRALGADVETMRRRIAAEVARLNRTGEELARSNADLEQFAYVASHDLSEPLRKVANFCQLLERQYGERLDERAHEYLDFAVDGARRMQALIADLLTLSRVGRTTERFVDVDLNQALAVALGNLEDKVGESGAGVGHSDLPTVRGDPVLLASLFENLVGNAIKYRGPQPPLVTVTAAHEPESRRWQIAVSDNGIGIDPQYADRIFAIFQRLHLRDAYSGTGIGLALCRKIVEFHGGRIWLDTTASPGATFRFTLGGRTEAT